MYFSHLTDPRLELQAGFTRGVGQRFHAAMVTKARAIESDQFDTGSLGLFGHALANQRSGGLVATLAGLASQLARTSASTVEALTRTRSPSGEMILA